MAYVVRAYVVMAYVVMAYVVMAYVVMAYVAMAYVVMALPHELPMLPRVPGAVASCRHRRGLCVAMCRGVCVKAGAYTCVYTCV